MVAEVPELAVAHHGLLCQDFSVGWPAPLPHLVRHPHGSQHASRAWSGLVMGEDSGRLMSAVTLGRYA